MLDSIINLQQYQGIAACCDTKSGMGYRSSKMPNDKEALNWDSRLSSLHLYSNSFRGPLKVFAIVRQMGELNQTPFQQEYFLQILANTRAESTSSTPLIAS